MDGGKVARRRRAMGECPRHHTRIHFACHIDVFEARFQWERIRMQPVEEGCFAKDAGIGILRSMDMCVWISPVSISSDNPKGEEGEGGEKPIRIPTPP